MKQCLSCQSGNALTKQAFSGGDTSPAACIHAQATCRRKTIDLCFHDPILLFGGEAINPMPARTIISSVKNATFIRLQFYSGQELCLKNLLLFPVRNSNAQNHQNLAHRSSHLKTGVIANCPNSGSSDIHFWSSKKLFGCFIRRFLNSIRRSWSLKNV
jgi:hypothetical protein